MFKLRSACFADHNAVYKVTVARALATGKFDF